MDPDPRLPRRILSVGSSGADTSHGRLDTSSRDEQGPARKWRFNVFVPDRPTAQCDVISLSGDDLVADLAEAVRKKYGQKPVIEGLEIELLKCEQVSAERDDIFSRVKDWLKTTPVDYMQNINELKYYFPNGPTADVQTKVIHVIVITDYVLILLDPFKYEDLVPSKPLDRDKLQTVLATALPVLDPSPAGKKFHSTFRVYGWSIEPVMSWHKFCHFWTGRDHSFESESSIFTLALDDPGFKNPDHRLRSVPHNNNRIYIRSYYLRLMEAVKGIKRKYKEKGIVISGQPGTGKTIWLWPMLTSCLMANEPVVFHYRGTTRLFLDRRVYYLDKKENVEIPHVPRGSILSLIDADMYIAPPPSYLTEKTLEIFPVQASSPNEIRYATWKKNCQGYVWGMPLWTFDEIMEGLKIHEKYESFVEVLQRAIASQAAQTSETADMTDSNQSSALSPPPPSSGSDHVPGSTVASPHPEGSPPVESAQTSGAYEVDEFQEDGELREDDERIKHALTFARDDAGNPRTGKETFELLVKDAMEQFGEVPRDITEAVFVGYGSVNKRIDDALAKAEANFDQLITSLLTVGQEKSMLSQDSPLHQLFAFQPVGECLSYTKDDTFLPKFKSVPTGKRVIRRIGRMEIQQARKFVNIFRLFPESSHLAGWIFQSLACQKLASADVPSGMVNMILTDQTDQQNIFVTADYKQAKEEPFPNEPKRLIKCHFPNDKLSLDATDRIDECLCVPANPNHPLFDAFFVVMKVTEVQVTSYVYIIQMTLSPVHEGSHKGYEHVKSILEEVERRAKERQEQARRARQQAQPVQDDSATAASSSRSRRVNHRRDNLAIIRYLYVSRTPKEKRTWKLPKKGWRAVAGELYCLHLKWS